VKVGNLLDEKKSGGTNEPKGRDYKETEIERGR
jgi:hypothetical protein